METLLSQSIQPPLLTLLSSTSSPNLSPLFTTHTDPSHPNSSIITTLCDADTSSSSQVSGNSKKSVSQTNGKRKRGFDQHFIPKHPVPGSIVHDVIHLQSPDPTSTYIQAGVTLHDSRKNYKDRGGFADLSDHRARSEAKTCPLGIELSWIGMQVKRLSKRGMAIEIGIVDRRDKEGVIRCSTWKSTPTLHPYRSPPLIHLPLVLPSTSETNPEITPWLEFSINLASLIPLFQSLPRPDDSVTSITEKTVPIMSKSEKRVRMEVPREFGYVSYVRVYANCRVQRIWFAADGERTLHHAIGKDEWGLFASRKPK